MSIRTYFFVSLDLHYPFYWKMAKFLIMPFNFSRIQWFHLLFFHLIYFHLIYSPHMNCAGRNSPFRRAKGPLCSSCLSHGAPKDMEWQGCAAAAWTQLSCNTAGFLAAFCFDRGEANIKMILTSWSFLHKQMSWSEYNTMAYTPVFVSTHQFLVHRTEPRFN